MKRISYVLALLVMAVYFGGVAAAEHPGTGLSEHPGEKAGLSAHKVISAIEGYIKDTSDKNNGVFPLYDEEQKKQLRLKLERVHHDKVSYIKKEDAYFACTDFITEDGKERYDVDFWMKKSGGEKIQVYMTKIHKKDGAPRYVYEEDEIVEVK